MTKKDFQQKVYQIFTKFNFSRKCQTTGIRVGIGNEFGRGQQIGYVLGELAKEEMEQMPEISKRVIDGVKAWATIGADRAMNVVNTRPQPKKDA